MNANPALPRAIEAETQVIGALLIQPERIAGVAKLLRPCDFTDPAHRSTWRIITELQRDRLPVDIVTVKQKLDSCAEFVALGVPTAAYLAETGRAVVTAASVDYHAGIVKEASRKRQLVLLGTHVAQAASNGRASTDIISELFADVDDLRRKADNRERFPILSARELDRGDFSIHYAVDRSLVKGQPCIVAGAQKTLKTLTLCDLGISVATGGDFLGKFPTSGEYTFTLFSGESGLGALQEGCRRIAKARGFELRDVPNFQISTALPQLDSDPDLAAFEAAIDGQDIVALDPAYLMMPGDDAGNLFKQGAMLRRLSHIGEQTGCTLLLCHHAKRHRHGAAEQFDPLELADIAWSGFAEWARQWMLIGRREVYTPGSGEHRLWLTLGGSAGHNSLWAVDVSEGSQCDSGGRRWDVSLSAASEASSEADRRRDDAKAQREAVQLDADRERVCRAMAKHPDGMTRTAIRDSASISGRRFPSVLAAMIEAGDIEPVEVRTGNQRTLKEGYKLKTNDAA